MAATSVLFLEVAEAESPVALQVPSFWSVVIPMVVVALAVRLLVAAFAFGSAADPSEGHDNFGWELGWTARSIALGHGFSSPFIPMTGPTALVPPLFTYFLAGIFKVFGLYSRTAAFVTLALDSLFSALTCIPIYLSTKHSLGGRAARWAGWAWVAYPYAIYFSAGIVWEFALTSLLFATCFWLAQRLDQRESPWGWMGYGVACGVTALCNPSVLLVLLGLLGIAAWKLVRRREAWVLRVAISVLALGMMLVPWMVRNKAVLHIWSPVRDGFWLECWAGNAGDSSESNPPWAHPASSATEMQRYQAMGEPAYMASKHTLAVEFISTHPGWFVTVTMRRFVRYWTGYWSFSRSYLSGQPLDVPNVFFCIPLTFLMALGAVRWARSRLGTLLPYLLTVVVFPVPYYVTHASMDYRQPIESVIVVMIVAAFALRPGRTVLEELASTYSEEEADVAV